MFSMQKKNIYIFNSKLWSSIISVLYNSWQTASLGCKLLEQLLSYLVSLKDMQMTATVVGAFGGSALLMRLLDVRDDWKAFSLLSAQFPQKANFVKFLNLSLYGYGDILQRWNMNVTSTEVNLNCRNNY